jgi:integrase
MNSVEHKWVGPAMRDRILGALETCCRQGEMLRVRNRDIDWTQHQIIIRGATAKASENRRVPFDPHGRLAPILKRRSGRGPGAFVVGSPDGEFQDSFKTAWDRSCWSRTGTKRSGSSLGLASTVPRSGRSTSTGTISVTKARADCWRMAWTFGSSN